MLHRSAGVEYLLPYLVSTISDRSADLTMNNDIVLLEPIAIASVITFGIGGDCIVEELIINGSIDDIYGNEYTIMMYASIHILITS